MGCESLQQKEGVGYKGAEKGDIVGIYASLSQFPAENHDGDEAWYPG